MINNLEHPDAEMMAFIREITQRQALKLLELAQEQKLLTPFLMEHFDADGERYLNQLWDLDENGDLEMVEDNSPDRTATGIPWPVVMRFTGKNGRSVELSGDDVRNEDEIGLQVVFPDKRPFRVIKALAIQVFGENVASTLQSNQTINFSNVLKPTTETYEITLPGSLQSNLEKISKLLESPNLSIFRQRWHGQPGPRLVSIFPD